MTLVNALVVVIASLLGFAGVAIGLFLTFSTQTKLKAALLISFALNVLFGWWIHMLLAENEFAWKEQSQAESAVKKLINIFPKRFYSRNELALSLIAPAYVPFVVDCLVASENLVFVFDRNNEIQTISWCGVRQNDSRFVCNSQPVPLSKAHTYGEMQIKDSENACLYMRKYLDKDAPVWNVSPRSDHPSSARAESLQCP